MFSASDILKLLEQVPIWKTLKSQPARIDALENRIETLEQALSEPRKVPGEACPACGDFALRRTESRMSTGPFGPMGARDEVWTCETCDEVDERFGVM